MDPQINNSVLSVNNQFYKVFKRIIDKKGKNASTKEEIEWINNHLLHENPKICECAVTVLVHLGKSEFGLSLNYLISALSSNSFNQHFEIIANGIFKLLQSTSTEFEITEKAHPAILLISPSTERMNYLTQKIEDIFNTR